MFTQWLARLGLVPVIAYSLAVVTLTVCWLARPLASAATGDTPPSSVGAGAKELDSITLAARIDEWLATSWVADKIEPAPLADDSEFLRRVYLDLAGKIPPVSVAQAFLDDPDLDKRSKLADQLLEAAMFPAQFAKTWRDLLLPGASNNIQTQFLVPPFEAWLRLRLAENTSYDKLVVELMTTNIAGNVAVNPNASSAPSPAAFFQVNDLKPENLAASTSRIFLGVQLQCAQCHNHPFARWSREEFWRFAAFFRGIEAGAGEDRLAENTDQKGIEIPGTGTFVEARFLDGSQSARNPDEPNRAALARWLSAPDNPYFARAAVNRLWSHFFGHGLVDPADDLDEANPPSHPEILDELARQFAYHGFDLKYIARAITATRAYQLSSKTTHRSQDDPRYFARMPLRSMTGDQLFDSLVQATGFEEPAPSQRNAAVFGINSARTAFLGKFSDTGPTRTDYQPSILQALTLMNGQLLSGVTSVSESETLQAVLEAPFLDTAKRIDLLFLATLTRRPTTAEAAKFAEYVQQAGTESERKQALADVFWALLNSAEFALNH